MNQGWPTAVINGIDHFVAKRLATAILGKDINVIGVKRGWELTGLEGEVEIKDGWGEAGGEWNYVFDFLDDRALWKEVEKRGARLTIIAVGGGKHFEPEELGGMNRRRVEAFGVYGPEMDRVAGDKTGEWLVGILRQAVMNQNLALFGQGREVRLLAADDLVEAVLKASLMSGMEGRNYMVAGEKVATEKIAAILMDEAKMTRRKVMVAEDEISVLSVDEYRPDRERLRWVPEIEFGKGIKEVLQYFFTVIDEERRGIRRNRQETHHGGQAENKLDKPGEEEVIEIPRLVGDKVEREENFGEPMAADVENFGEPMEEIVEEEAEGEGEEMTNEVEEAREVELRNLGQGESDEVGVVEEAREVEPMRRIRERKINWRWGWGLVVVCGLMLLSYFPVRWLWKGVRVVGATDRIAGLLKKEDYREVKGWLGQSKEEMLGVEQEMNDLGVARWSFWRDYGRSIRTLVKGLATAEKGVAVLERSKKLDGAIWEGEKIDWTKEIEGLKDEVGELGLNLGELRARLKADGGWSLGRSRGWWQKKELELEELAETLTKSEQVLGIVGDLIGTDGSMRKYLVLFQNENELRPGGGFVGSYGLLTWQGGWLRSLEVRDIYEADGQLKGHVEPPEEIKKYLGEAGWMMRDANWKADFPEAAKDIEWFAEKEIGTKVDGVIGINLLVAKQLLSVIGEIEVPEFGEKIDSENLYEQAEFYAETKFFPGSIQKASFLGAVGRRLFEEIREVGGEKKWMLYRGMLEMLERNEIQIAVRSQQAKKVLSDLGWDGGVWDGKCGSERCYADYLYVVEANLGVNKANYFLKRNIEQLVEIKERTVERVVRINYENTAKNSNWPGGDYKNYVRIYLPGDIVLDSISLWSQGGTKKVLATEEMKMTVVGRKKEIGFWMVVPVGEKRVVEMRYASGIDLNKDNKFSYLNYIQRQSGYGDTGLVGLVSFPIEWKALQVQPAATMAGEKLLFNVKFDRDIKMGVEIGR